MRSRRAQDSRSRLCLGLDVDLVSRPPNPQRMNAQLPHPSDDFAAQLSAHSVPYADPLDTVPWDSLTLDRHWLPERLLSLHGLPEFEALPQATRMRLSQCEFVALCELGLWLEAVFIQRLGQRTLEHLHAEPDAYTYRLHELREEAGHSLMFLEVQKRAHVPFMTPPGHWPRLAQLFASHAGLGSLAYMATILLGEDVPDRLNRMMYADKDLPAGVRTIVQIHMRDEARHMAFARASIMRRASDMPAWRKWLLGPLMREVIHQFLRTAFYPAASVYAAAGLEQPERWVSLAAGNPARAKLVNECAEPCRQFLRSQGIRV